MEFYMPDYTVDYEVNKLDPRLKIGRHTSELQSPA